MISSIPRPEYPRPNFRRELWSNLNGEWDFCFDDNNIGEKDKWYKEHHFDSKILVPFCFQSKLSGIDDSSFHDYVWYKREFEIPSSFAGSRVILHFGAVDYYAKIWVNGEMVGDHRGGHVPFSFDITNYINKGTNYLVVKAEDKSIECRQPRGKQGWKEENFGCWYYRTTGIWQTVWLEAVPYVCLKDVRMTPDIGNGEIGIEAELEGWKEGLWLKSEIYFNGTLVACTQNQFIRNRVSFKVDLKSDSMEWKIAVWSPESPNLYDVIFKVYDDDCIDQVESYFGMRSVSFNDGKFLLNSSPYYQKLILDQGYFPDSLLTPPSQEAIKMDIEFTKAFGYNGARKHQKVEDPIYLYWCDKMGLLVWGEMASPYEYDAKMVEANTYEWLDVLKRDYDHPSIVVWTLMNESWGIPSVYSDKKQQHHTMALYHMVKSLDSTRLVVTNDGWEHTCSDIITIHDYIEDGDRFIERYNNINAVMEGYANGFKPVFASGFKYEGQPVILSEFGGIAFDSKSGWGYGNKVGDEDAFLNRFRRITKAIADTDYMCGYCYTQLTDVQQEVNGLLTFDRKPKIAPEKIKKINDAVK